MHTLICLSAILLVFDASAVAQTAPQQNVEVDPVQCWWRTSTTSIRVGEEFTIHLTCSALETDAAIALIDRSRLGTAAVQFPPFEVTGGTQSPDHVTSARRFMQYHYNLRLIGEDVFGLDVVIPAMNISYRIESHVQSDAAVQGREQTYEMPALTVRVNSLVPNATRHIREAPVPSFDAIAAREFRARMFRLVAMILFGIAGLTLLMALLRFVRAKRRDDLTAARHFVPARTVLAGVRRELREVQRQTRGVGWNLDAIARALAATRIAASYLAGHTVAQIEADEPLGGQFGFARGWLGRRRVLVSASATAQAVRGNAAAPDLDDAMTTLTAARYSRAESYNNSALDEALATSMRAADRAASAHTWIADLLRSLGHSMRGWAPRAWAR